MSRADAQACVGDCDSDGALTIEELVTAVNIAADREEVDVCPSNGTTTHPDPTHKFYRRGNSRRRNPCRNTRPRLDWGRPRRRSSARFCPGTLR